MAWLLPSMLLSGCGLPMRNAAQQSHEAKGPRVYLVGQGWHAGLIIERRPSPTQLWPEPADFPDASFVEIGWGERDFYQSEDPGVWLALKAALWPSSSVLFLSGLRGPPEEYFPCSDLIELQLSPTRFEKLIRYIHDSFDRSDGQRVPPLRPGSSPSGRFYPARGNFHLFNTCNTWTARALAAAGYPLGPPYALTSDRLVSQVRPWGTVVAPLSFCLQW